MSSETPPTGLDALGALSEPTRRALYDHVVASGGWVSRDAAADALGLERATAAHHLDRLAADGLLDVEYRRLSGRSGPGAGRPAKLYARAARDIDVSLPPRRYELAGALLAEAVDRSRGLDGDVVESLHEVAEAAGAELADRTTAQIGRSRRRTRESIDAALTSQGYEPERAADGTVLLRNCPFHTLAQEHTELICSMNQCLLDSMLARLGATDLDAVLDKDDGYCCVKLQPR
jgi:predicted ArsR family transcriptional regulator